MMPTSGVSKNPCRSAVKLQKKSNVANPIDSVVVFNIFSNHTQREIISPIAVADWGKRGTKFFSMVFLTVGMLAKYIS